MGVTAGPYFVVYVNATEAHVKRMHDSGEGNRHVQAWLSHKEAESLCEVLNQEERKRWRFGLLIRKESCWVGVHYSPYNKRWCINVLPFVTVWVCKPGGNVP